MCRLRSTTRIALAAEAETRPRVAFVYIASDDTVLLFGESTVGGGLMAAAGAINVASDLGIDGWVPLTPEALVAGDPDVIMTASRGVEAVGGIEAFLEHAGGCRDDCCCRGQGARVRGPLHPGSWRRGPVRRCMQVVLDLHPELAEGP